MRRFANRTPSARAPRRPLETLERRVLFAAGDLDTTFGQSGLAFAGASLFDEANAVVVQPDGKVVMAGSASDDANIGGDFVIARLLTTGALDTTFGAGGVVRIDLGGTDDAANALLLQPDGKIVVGGTRGSQADFNFDFALVRLDADGTPDNTFGTAGRVTADFGGNAEDRINALALQPDNKIVAAGIGTSGNNMAAVARYNPNGTPDTTFGTGGKTAFLVNNNLSEAHAVTLQGDGKIVLGVDAASLGSNGGVKTIGITRLMPNGGLDTTFGTNGSIVDNVDVAYAGAIAVANDGDIYVAATVMPGNTATTSLYKYTPTGARRTTFGTNGAVAISTGGFFGTQLGMAIQSDLKVLVGATSSSTGGSYGEWTVARVTPAGVLDPTFSTDGKVIGTAGNQSSVHDLALAPDGNIVVAGYGAGDMLAARYLNDAGTGGPGSISGVVYHDQDEDGVFDPGEPGLSGWRIYQDVNGNGLFDTGPQTVASADVPKTLPSNAPPPNPVVTTSNLVVANAGTALTDINVRLNITHRWDADLTATLIAPDGQRVVLFQQVGGAGQNFNNTVLDDEASQSVISGSAPFAGSYRPQQPLTAFDGSNPNGTWQLRISDEVPNDAGGSINSWSLSFDTGGEPSVTSGADGTYTFADVAPGNYTLREVVQAGWSYTAPAGGFHDVTVAPGQAVTARDFGNTNRVIPASVVGRNVFYNNSVFDGHNAAANAQDDAAVATDKQALLPSQRAAPNNTTGYVRGLNGVMIDMRRMTSDLSNVDFDFRVGNTANPALWAAAPAPLSISERAVAPGVTRVTVIWADNAIGNKWLQVTAKANTRTGLAVPDVFYFGNLVGETAYVDPAAGAPAFKVDARDAVVTRAGYSRQAGVANPGDHNRDGRVDIRDEVIVRQNYGRSLLGITAPAAPAAAFSSSPIVLASATRSRGVPITRSVLA
jgi:uncharacterized delta-60 repeat protein